MNKLTANYQFTGYASFMQRTNAFLVDCIVFFPLNFVSEYNLFYGKNFAIAIMISLAWILYKPLMEWKFGATLGKMALKLRVVNDNMEFPPFNQVMLRFTPYFAITLSLLLSHYVMFNLEEFKTVKTLEELQEIQKQLPSFSILLSVLFFTFSVSSVFVDEKKRAFHDKFSQTYCVVANKKIIPNEENIDFPDYKEKEA